MSRMAALEQRFEALQPRERTLVSVAVGVLLVLLVYLAWVEPAGKAAASQREQIDALAPQVAAQREALARVQAELATDPEAARRTLLEQLRAEAADLDARLRDDEAAAIAPGRMPAVLRELMGRDARLRLVAVEALAPDVRRWTPALPASGPDGAASSPAATAAATPAPDAAPAPAGNVPALYRHRVVLRFEADFAATLDYVRAVEALPMRVRLEALEVDATRWPRLGITLQVETLGLEEGWIGV
jgi:MSHA biogenesis protein MshJ